MHISINGRDNDKELCPICECKILKVDVNTHVSKCYKFAKEGTLIDLPKIIDGVQPQMKFENYKHMLKRPYYACGDIEAILCKSEELSNDTTTRKNIAIHKPIATSFYAVP